MADCGSDGGSTCINKDEALQLKGVAIAAIFVFSALGVAIPLVGKKVKGLRAHDTPFMVAKSFAAGVILATGFVHIWGEASERLESECLPEMPWHKFPWTGFIAMMAVLLTLIVDALGSEYYEKKHGVYPGSGHETQRSTIDSSLRNDEQSAIAVAKKEKDTEHLRHVVISQVLELGIITHSVIIGISLGVSDSPCSIKPLLAALVFHQFFEGVALGGCIAQAGFKKVAALFMSCSFAATTPLGIALGIGIASSYNENSQSSLIIQGVFDAISAGILIYMALVDLIAHDFLGERMKGNRGLQVMCYVGLFIGAGAMAAIAIWA